jgi:nucleotide-binding universal stress UspA family protein
MTTFKNIVVPVDFSDHAKPALDQAIAIAKTFSAKIHLVHVIHFPVLVAAPEPAVIPPELWKDIRDGSARKLLKTEQTVSGEGVEVETHLREPTSS